jgi:hypothetical protein
MPAFDTQLLSVGELLDAEGRAVDANKERISAIPMQHKLTFSSIIAIVVT